MAPPARSRCPVAHWLEDSELRIGLGCMRLAAGGAAAARTIAVAAQAGITVFDTARAYGESERLLADALRECGATETARIVTKGGMTRPDGAWLPDGRAKSIARDCEASLAALGGLAIDLYLLHTPDPRTPWATSVRALARLREQGLVRHVGVSNVNRRQLDEALALAPIAAVEVALSVREDRAVRGGILERCDELGIALIAHSPLGGPQRAGRLGHDEALTRVAARHGVSAAQVALAWLLSLSPNVVAIPGARRPETARLAAQAAGLVLDADDAAAVAAVPFSRRSSHRRPRRAPAGAEVVLVMGIPGAGKTRLAREHAGRGYLRLNRDERGGNLRDIATALRDELAAGAGRIVLDNTYLTRAARSYVLEAANGRGVPVRCVWLDISLADAQVNLVERMLERFGALPAPELIRRRREPGLMLPTSQMRTVRELEPPALEEGFASIERVPFTRAPQPGRTDAVVFVAAGVLASDGWQRLVRAACPAAAHLVFDWRPDGTPAALEPSVAALAGEVTGPTEAALCPHGGGPPSCWCRPPLPGLPLAFAHRHGADTGRSVLIGSSPAHRTLAATLGARFIDAAEPRTAARKKAKKSLKDLDQLPIHPLTVAKGKPAARQGRKARGLVVWAR